MAMALLPNTTSLIFILLIISATFMPHCEAEAHINLVTDDEAALHYDNLASAMSLYDMEEEEDVEEGEDTMAGRRSLLWHRIRRRSRYYISYGVLMANKIPCPPRSGMSYYTHNCYKHKHTANPYTRGCSSITRCRR